MHNHPPIGQVEGKKPQVESMFDAIASRYDFLNRLLSLGIDQYWRKQAVRLLQDEHPRRILDVATGTADLAIQALDLEPEKVVGIDISEEMLRFGREKLARLGLDDRIVLQRGDAERLPFSDRQFDAVLVAFGVRNFENLRLGLSELRRILRPGGAVAILEPSYPTRFPMKQLFYLHFRVLTPLIGRLISGDNAAYTYLPDSVRAFPNGKAFTDICEEVGFSKAVYKPLTFGICSLYLLEK